MTPVRKLLKSCARPPVSCPIASIFCDWRSSASTRWRSVIARSSARVRSWTSRSSRSLNSRERLARAHLVVDVGAGAEPADDAIVLAHRNRLREVPAIEAAVMAHPVLDRVVGPRRECAFPGSPRGRPVFRMQHRRLHHARVGRSAPAGVVEVALVEEVVEAVGTGRPHHLRHRFGDRAKARLALAQPERRLRQQVGLPLQLLHLVTDLVLAATRRERPFDRAQQRLGCRAGARAPCRCAARGAAWSRRPSAGRCCGTARAGR